MMYRLLAELCCSLETGQAIEELYNAPGQAENSSAAQRHGRLSGSCRAVKQQQPIRAAPLSRQLGNTNSGGTAGRCGERPVTRHCYKLLLYLCTRPTLLLFFPSSGKVHLNCKSSYWCAVVYPQPPYPARSLRVLAWQRAAAEATP